MRISKLEKILLGIIAVLCVAVVALLVRDSGKDGAAPPVPPARPDSVGVIPPPASAPDPADVSPAPAENPTNVSPAPAEENSAASAANNAAAPAENSTTPAVNVAPPPPQTDPRDTVELISAEDAKAAALNHAGLTAEDVTFTEVKLEWEDGRQVYDVEFYSPAAQYDSAERTEYDYEIDAATGSIVKFDYDAESYNAPNPSAGITITQEAARNIALEKVPGAAADNVTKLKLDRDDGIQVYEVEIIYNEMEYDLEIDAGTGTVLEFEAESIYD